MANSLNELLELGSNPKGISLENWFRCQDNAATAVVVDDAQNGSDGALASGNTQDKTTTGPSSYLPAAFRNAIFNMAAGDIFNPAQDDFSILFRFRYQTSEAFTRQIINANFSDASDILITADAAGNIVFRIVRPGGGPSNAAQVATTTGYEDFSWHDCACVRSGSSLILRVDDEKQTLAISGTWDFSNVTAWLTGFSIHDSCDFSFHSFAISDGDFSEFKRGPEPTNSVQPAAPAGSGLVGTVHTAVTGTWGLPSPFAGLSNGSLSYVITWYLADDAIGTNATPIAGASGDFATFSTHTPAESAIGKHLGYKIAASNSGDNDPTADTFSAWMSSPLAGETSSEGWVANEAGLVFARSRPVSVLLFDQAEDRNSIVWRP